MSEVPLPDVHDSLIDDATLDQLVADLDTHATVLDVLVKGGAQLRTDGKPIPLQQAVSALRKLQIRALQVRYRFQDAEWRDTVMATPSGWRIVRINLTEALG